MDRRKFVVSLALGTVASAIPGGIGAASSTDLSLERRELAGIFSHLDSARAVGRRYLEQYPQEADTEHLKEVVYGASELKRWEPEVMPERLEEKIRRDFEQGRTVCLSGWILSRTESRLCALVALL